MWGFEARDELALAVVCWFWPFLVMWWVCVCLGFGQCFWGSSECAGFGDNRLIYHKLKEIRETTMSIYSNQGCVFSYDNLIYEVICLNLYVCTATNSSNEERGIPIYWSWGYFFFNP